MKTTIADTIRAGLAAGKTNDQILADVRKAHPGSNTTAACVSYYRSKAKKAPAASHKEKAVVQAVREALPSNDTPTYTVKGIKTFTGMEGHGYNATLYRDGKAVAFVIDDASGGDLQIEWKDHKDGLFAVSTTNYKGEPWTVKMTLEEQRLHELCASMPHRTCEWVDPATGKPSVLATTMAIFIEELVNDALMLRDIARLTKGKVAFALGGKLYTIKMAPSEANIATVRAKNVGCVVLNGLPDAEALKVVRATS